ncbi:MAG: hypothetical protein EXS58_03995 [Candidatus Latescibacteria bacterium]|nr:hypothetical protein [Candidatus Latescibacterota bacterium]
MLAQFDPGSQPKALSVDRQGRILVADYAQRRVVLLQDQGNPLPLAGNGLLRASGEGGPALNASLYQPFGLAYDNQGILYIADRRNHLVRRVRTDGIIERVAGTGLPGFGGDGGPARLAPCNQPTGLAFDSQGNLYIADSANHRVRKLDTKGNMQTVAGTSRDLLPGEGGPALESALSFPVDLSFSAEGLLFIADAGSHRVYTLSPEGLLRSLAGTGSPGQGYDGALAARAALNQPLGLVADGSGGVYLADTGNGRLLHVDGDGVLRVLETDAGRPARLTLDPRGGLMLADIDQHRVARLPVARQLVDAGVRIHTSLSYQLESKAALSTPDLLELVYHPDGRALYFTHREGVEQLLPARHFFAHFQASSYRTALAPAALGAGLMVLTPPALDRSQPLTLIAADSEGKALYLPLAQISEAADALASAGGRLYLYQQDRGRLLRLNDRGLETCATLSAGPALLEAPPPVPSSSPWSRAANSSRPQISTRTGSSPLLANCAAWPCCPSGQWPSVSAPSSIWPWPGDTSTALAQMSSSRNWPQVLPRPCSTWLPARTGQSTPSRATRTAVVSSASPHLPPRSKPGRRAWTLAPSGWASFPAGSSCCATGGPYPSSWSQPRIRPCASPRAPRCV